MTFLEKLKEIDLHLNKIRQVNENIGSGGSFTSLENDIVKDHLRQLYELYNELCSMKRVSVSSPEQVEMPQVALRDTVVVTPASVEAPQVEATIQSKTVVSEEVIETVESPEPVSEALEEMSGAIEDPAPEEKAVVKEAEDGPVSLFEKFKKVSKEVNTSGLSDKPLKEIIPLNDKFMFIKEFFDNSISKYEEMLEKVENAGKKDSAVNYMKDNVWSPEIFEKNEELIDRFIRILDTKFKD